MGDRTQLVQVRMAILLILSIRQLDLVPPNINSILRVKCAWISKTTGSVRALSSNSQQSSQPELPEFALGGA